MVLERIKNAFYKNWPEPEIEAPARANKALVGDKARWEGREGIGGDWRPQTYGNYYAQSPSFYAALRMRANAIAGVPLRIMSQQFVDQKFEKTWTGPMNPVQALLDFVNPFWTRGQLWRATEIYINIWGSAFWGLELNGSGQPTEIWPLRSDRMRIVPDAREYIKGYVYVGADGKLIPYMPDEIIRFHEFNPLDEFAGMSPVAPIRLSMDIAADAMHSNRSSMSNDSSPGMIVTTQDTPTDDEVTEFWERWEQRHKGRDKRSRPAVLSAGMQATNLGFSPKDMMYNEALRWMLADVSRAEGVPTGLLGDMERMTFSNYQTQYRAMWELTIIPQLTMYQEVLTEFLIPAFGGNNLIAEFDLSQVKALQENTNDKSSRVREEARLGIISRNEARIEIGLPPSDEPGMDTPTVLGFTPRPVDPVTIEDQIALNQQSQLPSGEGRLAIPGQIRRRSFEDIGREAEDVFMRQIVAFESSFNDAMRGLFNEQLADMLKRLDEHQRAYVLRKEALILAETRVHMNGHSRQDEDEDAITGGLEIFSPAAWTDRFREVGRPIFIKSLTNGAESQIQQFKLGVSFDVAAPLTQQWIDDRVALWTNLVNESTAQAVIAELRAANEGVEGIAGLIKRLQGLNDFNNLVRAERIARTEMVSANNEGHLQAYEQAEIPRKQWWTSQDERVRDSHLATHGQIRGVRELFTLGSGVQTRGPGQSGVSSEDVNCRDVTLPVLE